MIQNKVVFLDTAFAIALSAPKDQYHAKALILANEVEKKGIRLVTTRAITLEIGNALSKTRYRKEAIELIESMEEDANIDIVPISEQLYEKAFQLFKQRVDKEWGITDCIPFIIMTENNLTEALTSDEHFKQAGFIPLMNLY